MSSLFAGLSAFPLTPMIDDAVDERAYGRLVERLVKARVDSITALGSTGSYAYLSRKERRTVVRVAAERAQGVPVFAGIGALRTSQVQRLADDAQDAGADALLLAPLTYQTHTEEDVFGLYETVTASISVPLIVYDNPGSTHFTFTDELYGRIARLPHVASIKIPGLPGPEDAARERLLQIRAQIPAHVTIGISGDDDAAKALNLGCEAWYSVIAGIMPGQALTITRAAQAGDMSAAAAESQRLDPLWELFRQFGSLRVVAAVAEHYALVARSSLPLPLIGLDDSAREAVVEVVERLSLQPSP